MRAYHRLAGDLPSRGYGAPIRTEGFPEDGAVITGTVPRLVEQARGAYKVQAGRLIEQGMAWELLQTAYASPLVVRSVGVSNGIDQAHSYMDMVVADCTARGEGAPTMEELLRFDQFIPSHVFWGLPANTGGLPADEWRLSDAPLAEDALCPMPAGEAFEALLVRYWHAASMQVLGPWTTPDRQQLAYPVSGEAPIRQLAEAPSVLVGCISEKRSFQEQFDAAKALLMEHILPALPREVEGIASITACAAASAAGRFSHSALLTVLPEDPGPLSFDLRTGMMPAAQEDELALLRLIREKGLDAVPFLKEMRAAAGNGDRLAADWQTLLCLYRLSRCTDSAALARGWFSLFCLLSDRHLPDAQGDPMEACDALMRDVDGDILRKLTMDQAALQADDTLQSFFWRKALCVAPEDSRAELLAELTACCQTPDNLSYFLPRLIRATVRTPEQARRAERPLAYTLAKFYAGGGIDEEHLRRLMQCEELRRYPGLQRTVHAWLQGELAAYQRGERAAYLDEKTDYGLYLLPICQHFTAGGGEVAAQLAQVLSARAGKLLTEAECGCINAWLEKLAGQPGEEEARRILCDYLAASFRAQGDAAMPDLGRLAGMLHIDPGQAVTSLMTEAAQRLSEPRIACLRSMTDICRERCGGPQAQAELCCAIGAYARNVLLQGDALLREDECDLLNLAAADEAAAKAISEALVPYACACLKAHGAEPTAQVMQQLQADRTSAAIALIADAQEHERCMAGETMELVFTAMTKGAGQAQVDAIAQAAAAYARRIADGKSEAGENILAWLEAMDRRLIRSRTPGVGLADGVVPEHIIRIHCKALAAPAPEAFARLAGLEERSFQRHRDGIAGLYDQLLASGRGQDAAAQLDALLPRLGCITQATPELRRYAGRCMSQRMKAAWQTQPYRQGIEAGLKALPACGITADDLMDIDASLRSAAEQRAAQDARRWERPDAFVKGYQESWAPGQSCLAQVWRRQLQGVFQQKYDSMYQACRNDGEIENLKQAAGQIGAASSGAAAAQQAAMEHFRCAYGALARHEAPTMADAMQVICTAWEEMARAGSYAADSHGVTAATLSQLQEGQGKLHFPARAALSCMRHIPADGTCPNWGKVLDDLVPAWREVRKPFEGEGLLFWQTVTALIRALMARDGMDAWREALTDCLLTDGDMRPFLDELSGNKRAHTWVHREVRQHLIGKHARKGGRQDV